MLRITNVRILAACVVSSAIYCSPLAAEVLKNGFKPTAAEGWTKLQEGVFQRIEHETTHTYATGVAGAIYQLEKMSQRLRAEEAQYETKGPIFYSGSALQLRNAVENIMRFLESKPDAKGPDRYGTLCNNDLAWTIETSAINGSASGYAVWTMYDPSVDNSTKDMYTFASLKYSTGGGSTGYEDSDYRYIPVGIFAEIEGSAGVSGYGLPLINLYAYASVWTNECGWFFESLESNYNY